MSCVIHVHSSVVGALSAIFTEEGGATCNDPELLSFPLCSAASVQQHSAEWVECVQTCQQACYYGMWFESPCLDNDFLEKTGDHPSYGGKEHFVS
jgi:hypothetical protein